MIGDIRNVSQNAREPYFDCEMNAGIGASSATSASSGLIETSSATMLPNVMSVRTRPSAEFIIDNGRVGASCAAWRSMS